MTNRSEPLPVGPFVLGGLLLIALVAYLGLSRNIQPKAIVAPPFKTPSQAGIPYSAPHNSGYARETTPFGAPPRVSNTGAPIRYPSTSAALLQPNVQRVAVSLEPLVQAYNQQTDNSKTVLDVLLKNSQMLHDLLAIDVRYGVTSNDPVVESQRQWVNDWEQRLRDSRQKAATMEAALRGYPEFAAVYRPNVVAYKGETFVYYAR